MPFVVLVLLSSIAYSAVFCGAIGLRRVAGRGGEPLTVRGAEEVGEAAGRHPRLRRAIRERLDPARATGLLLTVALAVAVVGGVVLAIVTYLVRATTDVERVDEGAAEWAHEHAAAWSTDALRVVTDVGDPTTIVVLAVLLGVVGTALTRNRWVAAFLLCVVGGNALITTTIKELADRARPTIDPAAAALGPSFPSGHSSYSAAFFAAAALVVVREVGAPWARAALAGGAAAAGVAVASSRVLLDAHWVSDVVAGLALGWMWFAICAIAFGGRLLRFGAPAEAVRRAATS